MIVYERTTKKQYDVYKIIVDEFNSISFLIYDDNRWQVRDANEFTPILSDCDSKYSTKMICKNCLYYDFRFCKNQRSPRCGECVLSSMTCNNYSRRYKEAE